MLIIHHARGSFYALQPPMPTVITYMRKSLKYVHIILYVCVCVYACSDTLSAYSYCNCNCNSEKIVNIDSMLMLNITHQTRQD